MYYDTIRVIQPVAPVVPSERLQALAPWAELEIVARLLVPDGGPDLLAVNPPASVLLIWEK
jgi:hypothetical protein